MPTLMESLTDLIRAFALATLLFFTIPLVRAMITTIRGKDQD